MTMQSPEADQSKRKRAHDALLEDGESVFNAASKKAKAGPIILNDDDSDAGESHSDVTVCIDYPSTWFLEGRA